MTSNARPMRSMDEIIARAKARGSHFFDADTMRSFGSRLSETVYPAAHGTYFVTSERDRDRGYGAAWDGRRRYTVRYMDLDGEFHDPGEFGEHASGPAAHRAAERYQRDGHPACKYAEPGTCAHAGSGT